MNEGELNALKEIFEAYKKATMLKYGTPDQYQFRQNDLSQKVAEYLLIKFYQWEQQQHDLKQLEAKDEPKRISN
jgi:hypothetical protein